MDKEVILLVSPDPELRRLLEHQLPKSCKVMSVKNGRAAINKVSEVYPNLIISQYQIAEKNGLSVCNSLKFDLRTQRIPFLLLTSIAIHSEPVTGIEMGPDKILQSPYSIQDIVKACMELLQQSSTIETESSDWLPRNKIFRLSENDQMILNRMKKVIENHLDEADFSVKKFASEMNMSRMQLYRYTNELFDLSPTHLIRKRRLTEAAKLLQTTKRPISQIAYECGFSQPSYFSKCFKEVYGVSPKHYQQQ